MKVDHSRNIQLLKDIRAVPGIKKAFVASGVRYDLITADKKHGKEYLKEMIDHHISGQMKVAPEHTNDEVLHHMGKPGKQTLIDFKKMYDDLNKESGKKRYRDWETDRKSTRLNSSHRSLSRMPSSA